LQGDKESIGGSVQRDPTTNGNKALLREIAMV